MSYQALLFCPDEKTARVVTQVLTELDFTVEPCNEPFAAVKKLMGQHFDAVVVDSDNEQNATLLFKSARNSSTNHSSLAVAVVEGQAGVAKAFRIGANLVLTKPINVEQSKGTLRVARGLLRKGTEAAKPNAIPMTSASIPAAAAPVHSESGAKPGFGFPVPSKAQPSTDISAPPSSELELQKEPEPQPEPAEAALLESMPEPLPSATPRINSSASSDTTRDFPWQPVSKPFAEPMASAIRRAAEAAGKTGQADSAVTSKLPARGMEVPGAAQNSGWPASAAAPAPAKEKPAAGTPIGLEISQFEVISTPPDDSAKSAFTAESHSTLDQAAEAPSFASLDEDAGKTDSEGRGRTLTVAVALILLAAACGYFAWTKMHLGGGTGSLVQKPAMPAQTSAAAPPAQLGSSNSVSGAALPGSSQPATVVNPPTASNESTTNLKPSASVPKESEPPTATASKPAQTTKAPEPMVVSSEAPKPVQPKPAAEEAVAPPPLNALDTGSNSSALPGIVTSAPVAVPQRPPQALRVSQGVAQGLIVKRVQPTYPPHALQTRLDGPVQLQAVIDKAGNISNVKVLSGDDILARAAVDAVRQWKYKPYFLNGEPVEVQTQITINFKLPQ